MDASPVIILSLFILLSAAGLIFALVRFYARRAPEAKLAEPVRFKLLSANVGNASWLRMLSGFKLQNEDVHVLRQNISDIDPDIVFLQELSDENQVGLILNKGAYSTQFRGDTCTAIKKGVFADFATSAVETEGFLECTVVPAVGGDVVTLLNVHTASPMKDSSFRKRGEQIRKILDEIKSKTMAGEKIIAAGDFNFDPERFESLRHKLFNVKMESELDKTKKTWLLTFAEQMNTGLRLISPNEYTWFFTHKFTLDHVITNLNGIKCEILGADDVRIDVDHSGGESGVKERFMDHRALLCEIQIDAVNDKS